MSEKTEGYTLRDERNAFMQERDELLAELHRLDERLCKASGHWLSRDQMIDAITSERDEAVRERDELLRVQKPLMYGRYTVVWTNADKSVWFTTRVQNVADGAAAVLAVQMDTASVVTVINVFEGWPTEADDYDDLEGLYEEDEDEPSLTTDKAAQETKDGEG